MILFVHGVPDTPVLWDPLVKALGLKPEDYRAPALPGFGTGKPPGFHSTKDEYASWLITQMEAAGGKVHIVGHDWGALLTLRVASLRPDLVKSWCVTNAVIDPEYSGHRTARMWATPLLGEFVMLNMRNKARLIEGLVQGGMPRELAEVEVPHIDKQMRQSILSLYRSAIGLRFSGHWVEDLANLPKHGQLFWGENDPYVELPVAERFSKRHGTALHVERGTGHWACHDRAENFAGVLKALWQKAG
ncbi:hydrolase, alpha/beta fold family protein [Hyphomonas neptunium ATCC 15444]|uniref:Hydrolase, alpha/beta fold family protein n=2 Tax=Hyphomonas TaxID=85 RepID=Q0C4V5_HYPNA|nr:MULTISPECIES: alpha/beta hydrolase [Hyphomonas]ABI78606.1 hydrolase, alpha/beta fold family protein [Hyphomonas neptunium ATCC 15444]KCZ96550.1 alpha/beta fold family hydrolase [Hyphomonas hirschiana VP5]